MLEFNKYFIKEIKDLKDFITVVYVIVDDIYQEITPAHIKNRKSIEYSILSDSEIITISIVGELMTIDSKKAWFNFCKKNLRDLFPKFCDRTRFNRTRRNLQTVIEELTKQISFKLGYYQKPYRIVDSILFQFANLVELYFIKHLWELVSLYNNITIIGDKGYISSKLQKQLSIEKDITLITRKRGNSKYQFPKEFTQLVFKVRKRIESSFSQLNQLLYLTSLTTPSVYLLD